MDTLVLTAAVIGAVEFVKRAFDKDFRAAVTILVAAVIGGVFADQFDLTVLEGVTTALAGSGLVTTAQKVAEKK